ncbi:septum site-determining protein MinC [Sulfurihydrogenibium subterraneum]|uniref:septum site-determining protein MinC n=1 Tax=Sulfurihydrogenibium subterraneum TaxID=171121 RepID=UPI00048D948E|nr:septum site-determining protein MinC [Sulfurihydrogenibium subterraneum]
MGIEIKGLTVPALLIKLDPSLSVEENINQLEKKLSSAVFKGSYAVLDYMGLELNQDNSKKIEEILKSHNTKVLGYQNTKSDNKNIPKHVNEKKSLKIINKTLRSGQSVEYDGDVLILGDVNPDAYVIASGSIIVMGALRGVVHAGANGDETSIIMALKLMPQQLRIASYIARSPDSYEEVNEPEKAYIENNQIVIEKIK